MHTENFHIGQMVYKIGDPQKQPLRVTEIGTYPSGAARLTARFESAGGGFLESGRFDAFAVWNGADYVAPRQMSAVEVLQSSYDGPIPAGEMAAARAADAAAKK